MEIADIVQFLARTAPFDTLDEAALGRLAGSVSIRYARRGSQILTVGHANGHLYIVRAGAVELMELGRSLTARLGEGCCFAYPSLLRDGLTRNAVSALEDTLLYLVPAALFHELRHSHENVRNFFIGAEAERLRTALAGAADPVGTGDSQPVGTLIRRPLVTCTAETSLSDAAKLMTEANVSTVLVLKYGQLSGIATDRDFRARAVAHATPGDSGIDSIMTPDPLTVHASTPVIDALSLMLEKHIHHLPVLGEDGSLSGMISAGDILASQSSSTTMIAKNIHRAESADAVRAALKPLQDTAARLIKTGSGGPSVAAHLSSIGHTVHRRIIDLAERDLGPAPVPYCYLVFGSLARRDQTAHSDQDNGLLIDDDYDPARHGAWFEALARRVSDDLNACGYAYCSGGIMATTDRWRQPLRGWQRHFEGWVRTPEPTALMHATIFFDLAPVYGNQALFRALQEKILKLVAGNTLFLAHLTENALATRPPIGFFRRFVLMHDREHRDRLDIKKNGIAPLADIVRTHALAAGIGAVGIEDRLQALRKKGTCADSDIAEMLDAWHFLMDVRLSHQARQIERGETPDNLVAPDRLSPFEREHLRDAFSLIKTHQEGLSRALAGGFY